MNTKILLVDDDATQLKLSALRLKNEGFTVTTAGGADEAMRHARADRPDVIMSDVLMGDLDGFSLCRLIRAEPTLVGVPVILLSAHYQGEPDQRLALGVGASALVARTSDFGAEMAALRRCLQLRLVARPPNETGALYEQHMRTNAQQLKKLLSKAKNAEERYRALFENATDAISFLSGDGYILEANERWRTLLGFAPEELVGRHIRDFAAQGHEVINDTRYQNNFAEGGGRIDAVALRHKNGGVVYMDFSSTVLPLDGNTVMITIGRDVSAQIIAAQKLTAAELKYRSLIERIPDVIWNCNEDGKFSFMTPNVSRILGYTAEELCAQTVEERSLQLHPDDRAVMVNAFKKLLEDGTLFDVEYRRQRKDGTWIWARNRVTASYQADGVRFFEGMLTDITARKQLEESFRQSQKMEAIGQLTGGIAHDFNNLLAVIHANTQFLIEALGENDPRRSDAQEIKVASERAAALTRQLLAFSRRQVLEPTIVDLNITVGSIEKMLTRLIGEDVELSVAPAKELGSVRVDVGQIEQVLMNLAVNARDAMPTGGKLSIETANVELDESYAASHPPTQPGRYVMIAVSDSGTGMDEATKARIFEPFFTTKEVGRGTGLGLSTCYGIVKQSGGCIWVYSELGRGSTFKIYLPRVDQAPEVERVRPNTVRLGGHETILLIEDDESVGAAVSRMLSAAGYQLLIARNASDALHSVAAHRGKVDLVLSDVILSGGTGPEAVEKLALDPKKVIFMSGYTDHAVFRSGVMKEGAAFIQKPFSSEQLTRKVREVLDTRPSAEA